MLQNILNKQRLFLSKIGGKENLPSIPLDVHNSSHQAIIKDYAWRVVEELVEASFEHRYEEYKEELIDALCFLCDIFILLKISPEENIELPCIHERLNGGDLFQIIQSMGLTTHELKNRPWRTEYTNTNEKKFVDYLQYTNTTLLRYMNRVMTFKEMEEIHEKKYQKNIERFINSH